MRILSAASAFPAHHYSQNELVEAFLRHWGDRLPDGRKLELLHSNVGVESRFLSLPIDDYPGLTFGQANNVWIETAQNLGQKAVCKAIRLAGLQHADPGAFFFVSVTGIASPSIEARLINRMGLSRNIRRVPIFGLGCVAGAAGIARAADYVKAYPDQCAILLSVELCSLTLQVDDLTVANLISTGLFGDGAAAVIVAGDSYSQPGVDIIATKSIFYPDTERVMGWDISESGFRIVLSPEVPDVVAKNLGGDMDVFLGEHGLTRDDVGCWVLHTGGPKVLRATQQALGVDEKALAASWDCLRRMGNLSSASVLMVLEDTMMNRRPERGTWSVLAAMGPGFCSELVLLRW
ncbi:MAG: alkylresorcinol/alkylpyrone synthase [Bryobacterales bacterium]|jgi:alkylresorcinol/alkylpyrone synthase|nr:alkylresorcinol/alkylpyrone synthase [Bryobacterales bacterium]